MITRSIARPSVALSNSSSNVCMRRPFQPSGQQRSQRKSSERNQVNASPFNSTERFHRLQSVMLSVATSPWPVLPGVSSGPRNTITPAIERPINSTLGNKMTRRACSIINEIKFWSGQQLGRAGRQPRLSSVIVRWNCIKTSLKGHVGPSLCEVFARPGSKKVQDFVNIFFSM